MSVEPKQVVDAAKKANVQKKRDARTVSIYSAVLITQRVPLSIIHIGDNIKQALVKPLSCKVMSYSSGELFGSDVMFVVIVECQVCCPVEGMNIICVVNNITESAGIKAETEDTPSPVIIYIARDHHFKNTDFSKITVGDKINVRVIGQRFELNDKYVSVIAEFIEPASAKTILKKSKKLAIIEEK
jgi:hypothetical protein